MTWRRVGSAVTWRRVGSPAPAALRDARIQLHWAAQVLSATADSWLERAPDDSHTNMAWSDLDGGSLLGHPTPAGLRLALALATFELVVRRGDEAAARLALAGATLGEALAWADRQAAAAAGGSPRGVRVRDYDMPDHPVRRAGAAFDPDPQALVELGRWYANGDRILGEIAAAEPGSTPIRCWPHHFDIAGIAYLTPAGARGPQIGFGLEPGDHYYDEPYFYLTAWPRRADPVFPPLAGGGLWRQGDFTGAVLLASSVVAAGDAAAQEAAVRAYFASAFEGARSGVLAPG
jgi:hypothetical protein